MKQIPSILVVDDDPVIAELVAETLRSATMDATVVTDGAEVLERLGREAYDLVILDVMMPGVSGYEVIGLMSGGDDYIVKPFLPRELVARVHSCLRRASYTAKPHAPDLLVCRGLEVDRASHVARLHGTELTLTPKEFSMLVRLLTAEGRPVSTKELYEAVWEEDYLPGNANSVMVHIRHLRTKLAAVDSDQVFIETVWGVGYKIAR